MQIPARPAFEVLLRTRRPAPLAPLWKDRQALLVRDDEGGEPVLQSVVFIILFYFIFPLIYTAQGNMTWRSCVEFY